MVRLIQYLCSERHAFLAMAYRSDAGEANPAKLQAARDWIDRLVKQGVVNPCCGLCGSTDLHWEDWATSFRTIEEAEPELRGLEHNQVETAQYLKASGKIFDPQ